MIETISNCFDSHVHLLATGQVANELKLNQLQKISDLKKLVITSAHYRGDWLVGFGWDENKWDENSQQIDRYILDEYFPDQPVYFSRVDGHSGWLNSKAILELERLKYNFTSDIFGGEIIRNIKNGEPTGILKDQAHINAMLLLPKY